MADQRFASPVSPGYSPLATSGCPRVAELITYALGQATAEDRQRIEGHLRHANCTHCRGWVEKAAQVAGQPWQEMKNKYAASVPPPLSMFPSHAARVGTPPPTPENARWQQDAFRDLEQRLKQLEEETRGEK